MKLREVLNQSEWENVPFVRGKDDTDPNAFHKERTKRLKSLRNQDNLLVQQYIAFENKYPTEFKSRGVPDESDEEGQYMEVPPQVENNPNAYDTIKIPGSWLYDMNDNERYPETYEEIYLLKTSPRYKAVMRILNRYLQIKKMRDKIYLWPPTVRA